MDNEYFKKCTGCEKQWGDRKNLLEDEGIFLIGYQFNKSKPERGLLLFNHLGKEGCGSTISIYVEEFIDLYEIETHEEVFADRAECPGLCGQTEVLVRCKNPCRFASIRELINRMIEECNLS